MLCAHFFNGIKNVFMFLVVLLSTDLVISKKKKNRESLGMVNFHLGDSKISRFRRYSNCTLLTTSTATYDLNLHGLKKSKTY